MLYVLRLAKGDCILAGCPDQQSVCDLASRLTAEDGESVVSIREISRVGIRLSPNDEGSLEIHSWDDVTLDDVLVNEYPALNEAFHAANGVPLVPARSDQPFLTQLKQAHEQNTEIIRKGLLEEQQRFSPETKLSSETKISSESRLQDRRKEDRRAAHK